jgi:chemotaxis protein histidine kinase CheA
VDRIKEMLDQLSELDKEQLADLQTAIVSEFETVEKEDPTPQTVDAMTSLADMLDTVRGEISRREAEAQELAARAAEAAMRVKGEEEMKEEKPEGEAPVEEEKEMPEEVPAPAMEEEKEEEKPMAEASTAVEEASELSTAQETPATDVAATEVTPAAEAAVAEETPAEAAAEVTPQAELSAEPTEAVVEEAPAVEAVAASADVAEVSETQETTQVAQVEQKEQEAPVTAAANETEATVTEVIEAPADRRPTLQTSAATVAITAGADIPGYTAGSTINNMSEVAEAMSKRLHALRRVNGGDGEQHIVASITTQYPEDRVLSTDAEENWKKIQNVVGPEALVAAGGHQAPFEVKYDIFGIGSTARPVRDCLPRFQADRGGIRYIVPPVLSDYADAVGVWTAANDSAETPSPASKLSLTVTAASETTVATDAVTLQLQFGNLLTRAYPELIARHNELGLIQHAREAETQILSRLTTLSTAVTSSSIIGFARDFLVQVGRAAAAYRGRHRLEMNAPLRLIAPQWVRDAMAADLVLAMPGDDKLNAYGEIDGYLAARGVNVCWSMEEMASAQGSGGMNEFPDTCTWYLFAEGTFLFLDGGTLDLGIIRDSTLVGTNDYKMFVETFEGVAKVGVEGIKVASTIAINGAAAALRDTNGGATAATIEY